MVQCFSIYGYHFILFHWIDRLWQAAENRMQFKFFCAAEMSVKRQNTLIKKTAEIWALIFLAVSVFQFSITGITILIFIRSPFYRSIFYPLKKKELFLKQNNIKSFWRLVYWSQEVKYITIHPLNTCFLFEKWNQFKFYSTGSKQKLPTG